MQGLQVLAIELVMYTLTIQPADKMVLSMPKIGFVRGLQSTVDITR
jgi:hypothetical protein